MINAELSPRQRRFIAAMMTLRTVAEAAQAVGVSERTGYKYLSDPQVRRALSQALDNVLSQVTHRVVSNMSGALDTLEAIHTDEDAPTGARVSAARAILDSGPRLREFSELCERIAELEQQLGAGG
jgi:phage terminase small subunit